MISNYIGILLMVVKRDCVQIYTNYTASWPVITGPMSSVPGVAIGISEPEADCGRATDPETQPTGSTRRCGSFCLRIVCIVSMNFSFFLYPTIL